MPEFKPKGLRGLAGLGSLNKAQYDNFIEKNRDLIAQHGNDPMYVNQLYSNKQFIDRFGLDKFKAIPDMDMRNNIFKADVINTEFDKLYKPTNTNKGLGMDYNKYVMMSPDAKLKLMESNYLLPDELNKKVENEIAENNRRIAKGVEPSSSLGNFIRSFGSAFIRTPNEVAMGQSLHTDEMSKQMSKELNQKIIDKIYNDDVDDHASKLGSEVSAAYNDPLISAMSDNQVKEAFVQAITPGSYKDKNGMPNMGIAEFASHYGNGSRSSVSSEMADFSIDDMRQILAKKKAYDTYMSPEMAATALNNEAKRYIKDHQGSFKRFGLFLKDVGISSMSYTADKMNGIAELYRMGQDAFLDKPIVMVDDRGNVIDPNKTKVVRDRQGNMHYQDKEGRLHSVHDEQIDYTTLHNMGKNTDGSDIKGVFGTDWMTLNPQYWNRAEQFGTLDENEQKQYEKLGSSPYKVAYNPNEDSDIWYEAFKMMSFGLADAGSQLIPYGIGSLGKTLSAAGKVGRVARGFGKVLDTTGKMLTAETKIGQIAQGTAGALGIAYAYNRGAFQETLQQNLANAEEAVNNASKRDIFNQYNKDKQYRANVDKLINARAVSMKADYIAQMQRDGGMRIADEKAIDKMIHAKAQDAVLGELVQKRVRDRMSSDEYSKLQQEAINSAGDAAFNTFLPEALKYGFVNTMGYRKFLYTNPANLSKKVSSSIKGLKEFTTDAGRKRMTTEASKFLTRGDKLKELGKTTASQTWGGMWTNGTDDMQVDAAERINEDSYNRYLNAYQNGEAISGVYGFADGLYSYMKGLGNSMGQETTLNSALVGGLGSIVNFTPNFANISRLATKEGREAYKNAFRKETVRDENEMPLKNEDGSVRYKNYDKTHNWREQLNYFVQNGVLNTYYGKKQAERDLQSHADYVNNLLDSYDDFVDIEKLVASNVASENMENVGDQKTMNFVKALHTINALDKLGNDSNDPTTMSSVVQNAKKLIEKAAQLNDGNGESPFNEEEISNLLSQYYASNLDLEQSDANNQKALYDIAQNAQMLQKASEAYEKAEKEIQKVEKNRGAAINPLIRERMKEAQALHNHWIDRKEKMQSEIDDPSTEEVSQDAATILATIGGKRNANSLIKVYDRQKGEIEKEIEEQKKKTQEAKAEVDKTINILNHGMLTSEIRFQAEQKLKEDQAKMDSSKEQEDYLEGLLSRTNSKRDALQNSIDAVQKEQEESSDKRDKVLTADEIFSLDPVNRARMMSEENRGLYDKEQQREIEKLEQRLLMRDADALQKVQDIALLTQRIATNEDAYSRMAKNPEAAAMAVENQRTEAAKAAYDLTNQRNAETFADYINQFDGSMNSHQDVSENEKNQFVFKQLRKLNTGMLDIIDKDELLPQYQQQIENAKDWVKTVEDIEAVIDNSDKSEEWKNNLLDNIHELVEKANDKDGIVSSLEKVVDDLGESQESNDFDYVLNGLENLGYQRDATILENRKKGKEREAEANRRKEEAVTKAKEEAKKAAEVKAQENSKKKASETISDDGFIDEETLKSAQAESVEDVDLGFGDSEIQKTDAKNVTNDKEVKVDSKVGGKSPAVDITPSNAQYGFSVNTKEYIKPLKVNQEETVYIGNDNGDGTVSVVPTSHKRVKSVNSLDEYFDFIGGYNRQKSSSLHVIEPAVVKKNDEYYKLVSKGKLAWTDKETYDKEHKIRVMDKGGHIRINYNQVVKVTPDEYESIPETAKHEENATFEAHSAEKDGDNWYFIGNFAGNQNETKVKSKKNLDKKVTNDKQQGGVKAESAEGQSMSENKNIIMDGEEVKGKSPSIEQQAEQSQAEGKKVQVSDMSEDADTTNSIVQQTNDTNAYSLGGNAMSRYKPDSLENDGKLIRKKDKEGYHHYEDYFSWMEAAGIKLQNIIDRELARIININPHAKVKFMVINPNGEATKDYRVQDDLFLVLDYDNSINRGITVIHDNDNGGVIESNGKKYLVIGVAGYPKYNKGKEKLYYNLWRHDKVADGIALKLWRKKQLDSNPNERFYVNEELSTKVVPYSQIPGYIVRQTEKDDSTEYRKVSELLADKERNPLGFNMKYLSWGIQEMNKFLLVGGATIDQVMVPRNPLTNSGSAFVLMPASNGKMVPSYLKPLYYVEMQDGTLKKRVQDLLNRVITPGTDRARFDNAINAINELCGIFYLTPEGDDIHRKGKAVTLVSDGRPVVFTLDNSFDRMKFMQAFEEMNPRVNITADVLGSQELLKEYDEAGALTTDAALFGTAGSSYSIYALDKKGKMIMPADPINPPKSGTDSDYRKEQMQIVYQHQYYREDNGVFSLDGDTVTDSKTIEQLQYNKRIIDNQLVPVLTDKTWEYFILSSGEHPEAIKVDKNTKEVKVSTEEEAQKLIDKINEEKAKTDREKAAEKAIEISEQDGSNAQMENAEDVDILDGGVVVDEETGEIIQDNTSKVEESTASVDESNGGTAKVTETSYKEDLKDKSINAVKNKEYQAPTQTFTELYNQKAYKMKLMKMLAKKWKDIPKTASGKMEFLRKKNVEVDAIGTSKADIEAWIKTIEDCR